ncbi:MAG: hypothetical protein EXS05_09510 [Planctomycetaceae bacterium]|nr:hypothetical protein [Planctomycetaceae bacterium]
MARTRGYSIWIWTCLFVAYAAMAMSLVFAKLGQRRPHLISAAIIVPALATVPVSELVRRFLGRNRRVNPPAPIQDGKSESN